MKTIKKRKYAGILSVMALKGIGIDIPVSKPFGEPEYPSYISISFKNKTTQKLFMKDLDSGKVKIELK